MNSELDVHAAMQQAGHQLATETEQHKQRCQQDHQRLTCVQHAQSRTDQWLKRIEQRLQKHGETLKIHATKIKPLQTLADHATDWFEEHERHHHDCLDPSYANHAKRLAALEDALKTICDILPLSTQACDPAAILKELGQHLRT